MRTKAVTGAPVTLFLLKLWRTSCYHLWKISDIFHIMRDILYVWSILLQIFRKWCFSRFVSNFLFSVSEAEYKEIKKINIKRLTKWVLLMVWNSFDTEIVLQNSLTITSSWCHTSALIQRVEVFSIIFIPLISSNWRISCKDRNDRTVHNVILQKLNHPIYLESNCEKALSPDCQLNCPEWSSSLIKDVTLPLC